MKTTRFIIASLALLAVAACKKDNQGQETPANYQELTFEATMESALPFQFAERDAITVYDELSGNTFVTAESGEKVSFKGTADASAKEYTALFPHADGARFSGKVQATLPPSQNAVKDGYDRSAILAAAKTTDKSLKFKSVVAFLKVKLNVTDYTVVSASVSANGGETLSGQVFVGLSDNPTIEPYSTGVSSVVTLAGEDISQGTYYIAVMPQTLASGYTLAFTNSYDGRYEVVVDKSVTFESGSVYDLGEVGEVEWVDKPNPNATTVPGAVLLKASFKSAEFNMVSEGGFEDYIDQPIFYRTAWIPINGADKNVSYETGTPLEGKATLHFDASPVGGVWMDLNQFIATPMNTDYVMSFQQSVNTPYSRNAFIGEGPRELWLKEIQGHDMRNPEEGDFWDLAAGYPSWNPTNPKTYTIEFNSADYYWGIMVFTIAGDPGRYEILDDVKLYPKDYSARSIEVAEVTAAGTLSNATYDDVTDLDKMLVWEGTDGQINAVFSKPVIRGVTYDNAVAFISEKDMTISKFSKASGKIKPAFAVEDPDITSIVPDDVFSWNGKSYMHYFAKTTQENPDVWHTKYSGFLVSEDGGKTWAEPAHGRHWEVWLEETGHEMKPPYEWFSEASICHADGYFYMVHGAWGRDWGNYSNYFVSRIEDTKDFTDPSLWEHWSGTGWSASEHDVNSSAMGTIGNRSEPCLVYNEVFGRFMLIYRSARHSGLVFRDAASVEGPWSGEKILTDDDVVGRCNAPCAIRFDEAGSLYLVASLLK